MVGSIAGIASASYATGPSVQSQRAALEAQIKAAKASLANATGSDTKTAQQTLDALNAKLAALDNQASASTDANTGSATTAAAATSGRGIVV